MRKLKKLLAGLLVASMSSGVMLLTACGGGGGNSKVDVDSSTNIDVYVFNAGYGVEWTEQILKKFAETDWVKEKYGTVTYSFDYNSIDNYFSDRMRSGSAVNKYDVLFSCGGVNYILEDKIDGEYILEDLSDLYNTVIPGENIKYGEKMNATYYERAKVNIGGKDSYRFTYWASGMSGIMYNATLLNKLGYEAPLTTNQFVNIMAGVKAKNGLSPDYPYSYSIMASAETGYWRDVLPIFWAQYEGIEEYINFFNGISENRLSKNVLKQPGRKEALLALEKILDGDTGYMTDNAPALDFKHSQQNFLQGQGIFIAEGDWFEYETSAFSEGLKGRGFDYDYKVLKTPIISAIVDKTPTIKALASERGISNDDALALVIKDVDDNKLTCSYSTVSADDYAIIVEARNIINTLGFNHKAVIPSYSPAKDVAKDFLLFCASDDGLATYAKYTNGAALPFYYDLETKAPEVYAGISDLQKSRLSIIKTNAFGEVIYTPDYNDFPICYKGGFAPWATVFNFESAFGSVTGDVNKVKAIDVYNGDIAFWTDAKWNEVVSKAHLG